MVYILKDFCVKTKLVPLNKMSTDRLILLANATAETTPVITFQVIRPASMMLVILLNRFIFFAIRSQTSISLSKYASITINFSNYIFVSLVVL